MNYKALERRVKRHIIAGTHTLFFAVQPGLEEALEKELDHLKLKGQRENEPGSLTVQGSLEDIWRCALLCRSSSRLYLRLDSFKADGFKTLKTRLEKFPWELYLSQGCGYRLRISVKHCRVRVHDKIGKALQHCLKERFNALDALPPEPSEDDDPSVQTIIIRGVDDRFTVSLDAGGGSLYTRGYRRHVNEAPLRENIAAALLTLADLPANTLLLDAMSGSGTFALEGLSLSAGLPVSADKARPYEYWPSFRPGRYAWLQKEILAEAKKHTPWQIISSDISDLNEARENARFFDDSYTSFLSDFSSSKWIDYQKKDFLSSPPPSLPEGKDPFLILNPPYGKRLSLEDQQSFFRRLGKTIKENYSGVPWGIIVPGLECEKALGLHWDKKYLFKNGGFPVAFLLGGNKNI